MQLLSYLLLGLIHAHGDSDKNDYEEVKAKNIKVLSNNFFSESKRPIKRVRMLLVKIIASMFCSTMITFGTDQ